MLLINLILFLILVFGSLYLIGFNFLYKKYQSIDFSQAISLSLALGTLSFVGFSLLFGILGIRFMTLPVILAICLWSIFKYRKNLIHPWFELFKNKFLLFLLILGILIQGFINFPSGYLFDNGLLFWSSQGHDGLWHVAVMEEIKKNLPPNSPIFSGESLYNYHYLVDVLMGETARIYPFFTSLDLYFRFFPIFFSFLMGISVYAFLQTWRKSKIISYWGIFFTYFCGGFGYFVTFLKNGIIFGGETVFWAAQGNTIIGNPPHAIAYSLVTLFFLSFYLFLKEKSFYWMIISFLLGFVLSGFKVSAGFVVVAGVCSGAFFGLVFQRNVKLLIFAILLALSNFLVFKSVTLEGQSFLVFQPWWFIRNLIVGGDRLDWIDLELKRQYYLSVGGVRGYLRVLEYELIGFFLFLIGNIGMRVLGFYDLFKKIWLIKKLKTRDFYIDPFESSLIVAMLTAFVVPMLFIQKGITYNIIQFMQYFMLIIGFYAAIATVSILDKFKHLSIKIVLALFIIIFSLPTVIGNLNEFYGPGKFPLAVISNSEIQAINFLKNNSGPEDIVLNYPFDKYLRNSFEKSPLPIYAWYSTAYISALSGRPTYLSSEEQGEITGYHVKERRALIENFFADIEATQSSEFLEKNHIKYIYLPKKESDQDLSLNNKNKKIFENSEVRIYKVE